MQTPPQRPVNFIFHTAFCGSTLLARYLDQPGWTFVYREPAILTSLVTHRFRRTLNSSLWSDTFKMSITLLSRTDSCNEVPIIKLHDGCSSIVHHLLSLHPDSKGLILYTDWYSFLLSIFRHPFRRKWVRDRLQLTNCRDHDLLHDVDIASLTDSEATAYLWMAQMYTYLKAIEYHTRRLYSLECNILFQSPQNALRAIMDHFCISSSYGVVIDDIARHEKIHAKFGHEYDAKVSAAQNAFIAKIYKNEIRMAHRMIEKVAVKNPLITKLPLSICENK